MDFNLLDVKLHNQASPSRFESIYKYIEIDFVFIYQESDTDWEVSLKRSSLYIGLHREEEISSFFFHKYSCWK